MANYFSGMLADRLRSDVAVLIASLADRLVDDPDGLEEIATLADESYRMGCQNYSVEFLQDAIRARAWALRQ